MDSSVCLSLMGSLYILRMTWGGRLGRDGGGQDGCYSLGATLSSVPEYPGDGPFPFENAAGRSGSTASANSGPPGKRRARSPDGAQSSGDHEEN